MDGQCRLVKQGVVLSRRNTTGLPRAAPCGRFLGAIRTVATVWEAAEIFWSSK